MTSSIGSDLAQSLVGGLGADCATAAVLARAMTDRYGSTIDLYDFGDRPAGALQRVTTDFVARGWLSRSDVGWSVGPSQPPRELASFLEGAAAMRAAMPNDGRATAVVTMPLSPSAIGAALPVTGLAHSALVPTKETFERLADSAASKFTIMTPFLNDDGLAIALDLFRRTRASRKCLIIRRSGAARAAIDRGGQELSDICIDVLDYTLRVEGGYETFHAKVLLADQDLAYVGSANMTVFARHSMELGILADGRAARVVASIVRAVERIAVRLPTVTVTSAPEERRNTVTIVVSNTRATEPLAAAIKLEDVSKAIAAFNRFLSASRKQKLNSAGALRACLALIRREAAPGLLDLLQAVPAAWADHAVASIYATRIPAKRRKELGAYFTPPHLVDHLVSRLVGCGMDPVQHRLRDPAAGGAAFLVPLARIKVMAWRKQGLDDAEIVNRLRTHLVGREIETQLAIIANALLRRMLVHEFGLSPKFTSRLSLVKVGDSLHVKSSQQDVIDHEVGNPPFQRLAGSDKRLSRAIFGEISAGRANLYALFVRRALEEVPKRGLVGYVIPASFLGGPEFALFRKRVLQLAEVLVVDLIEKRRDVFLDAIQDACFVVLRRRTRILVQPDTCFAKSGIFRRSGEFIDRGSARIEPEGVPWRLPGIELMHSSKLKDWGYRATVGYLVANRQSERLHKRFAKGRYPLIWAKAIRPEGHFDFERGAAFKGLGWVDAPADATYVVRTLASPFSERHLAIRNDDLTRRLSQSHSFDSTAV